MTTKRKVPLAWAIADGINLSMLNTHLIILASRETTANVTLDGRNEESPFRTTFAFSTPETMTTTFGLV